MQIHQDFSVTFPEDPAIRPIVRVGDHDLSDLYIDAVGPIVERLDSGTGKPFNRVWLPILFEGEVRDPAGRVRVVNDGEADKLDLPTTARPVGQLTVTCPDCHELVPALVSARPAEGRSNTAKMFVTSDAVERFAEHVKADPEKHPTFASPVE